MLVKDFMTKDVITVREDQSMLEAREVMRSKKLYSLPVVDDISRVRGIITVDDIGKASPSDSSTLSRYEANYLLGRLKVKDVMSRTVVTVDSEDTIEYVAIICTSIKSMHCPYWVVMASSAASFPVAICSAPL